MRFPSRCSIGLALVIVAGGCTMDNIQQTGYYIMQNFGAYQCQKTPSNTCGPRPSYDTYQRQRAEVLQEPAKP